MRRIRSTGCGYILVPGQTYTCSGVSKLTDMFKTTPTNIFGTEVIRTASSEEYSNEEWIGNPDKLLKGSIDNYAQLPQAFEGFVMTLTPVLDMDATNAGPEVPELECRINFDPFAKVVGSVLNTSPEYTSDSDTRNDGFLNLYNSVFPNYTKSVYVEAKTKEQLQTESVADSLIYYDMPAYLSGSTVTRQDGIGYVIQPNTDTETGNKSYVTLLAGPGILEPMLDTAFPPIGVDTITGPDIIGDFTMWEFNTIAQWQKTVDTRLNNIRIPSVTVDYGKVNGLINLENAKNQDGPCTNFQIQQISTNSVIQFDALNEAVLGYPEYFISGGDIVVDGEIIANISGLTATGAIFDAYLDIFKYGQTEDTLVLGATVTDRYNEYGFPVSTIPATGIFQHKKFEYIGSVTRTTNTDSPVTGGTIYTLYEIKQGECIYEITLGGTGGTTYISDYKGPFKLRIAGTTVYLAAGDELPQESTVVGGPTAAVTGETAARDYESYIVDIIDGAGSVPADENTSYAGYSITEGTDYDKIITHSFQVDSDATAASYLLFTKTLLGWDGEYVEYPDLDIPDTGRTMIPGTTINLHGTTVGQIIEGYTVTAIYGDTVSYTNGTTTNTAKSDEQYLVQLGVVSGGTVGQVQYGDIFIDKQDLPVPPAPPSGVYSGPFHVISDTASTSGFSVRGVSLDGANPEKAGKIYHDGTLINTADAGDVQSSAALSSGFVFAHITLTRDSSTGDYSVTNCLYDNVPTAVQPSSGYVYTIRLAQILSATEVKQFHYGDIYLYGYIRKDYTGPFTVTVENGIYSVTCDDCGTDESNNPIKGWYVINGKTEVALTDTYTGTVGTAKAIYFHKTATSVDINTSPATDTDPTEYTVRLANISGGSATQIHYGNIYIDGRWT